METLKQGFVLGFEQVFAHWNGGTQQTFTCLKSTIETLEKCVKYVQSWQ